MKFTNVKQLIIKFMGGGLINFPTRFLRWVKIDGDAESDDGGEDGDNSDVFFVPATIQPKYFINNPNDEPIEIKNYPHNTGNALFFYNKEDIISLGVNEENLNNLDYIGVLDALYDVAREHHNGYQIATNAFNEKIILCELDTTRKTISIYGGFRSYVYKISDDIFLIAEYKSQID